MHAAPHTVFTWALAIFIFCAVVGGWFVRNMPWAGFGLVVDPAGNLQVTDVARVGSASERLQAGDIVVAIRGDGGPSVRLSASTVQRDPDRFGSYSELDRFLSDQSTTHALLLKGDFSVELSSGAVVDLRSEPRTPLSALPAAFWYQVFWAGVSFLLVASVWSFRPDSPTTRYFTAAGCALAFATLCSAVYSSHGLGMDGRLVAGFLSLSHLSLYLSLASLLGLCWVHPRPLPGVAPASIAFFVLAGLWWMVDFLRVLPSPSLGPVIAQFGAGGGALLLILFRGLSLPPDEHASRKIIWRGVAALVVVYLIAYPASLLVLGGPLLERHLAMTLLHLVFLGAGVGIYLRALFQIDRWVWSAWLFIGVSAAMLVLDMLAVYVLGLGSKRVFAVSVILLAWLYFPLRQLLWVRWSGRLRRGDYRDVVPGIVEELLVIREEGRQERAWLDILERLWAPLGVEAVSGSLAAAELKEGGLALQVPPVPGACATVMRHADRGSRLFTADDVRFADTLVLLAHKIAPLKDAARSGAAAERRRVASDLHDHVVPSLLSFVYRADQTRAAGAGRAAIKELRQVITSLEAAARSAEATSFEGGS
ncbi:MAG: hypothetical protein ACT4PZ_24630 [Panacagrimonas sp.]